MTRKRKYYTDTKVSTIRLPIDLWERIRKDAIDHNIPLNELLIKIVKIYLSAR